MTDSTPNKRGTRWAGAAGLMAAGAIAGGVLAGALSANAASTVDPTTHMRGNFPAHGTAAHEALEKPVTGANATKAQAAAVQAVGSGAKAGAVTTDASGDGYEVTVTKSDGSTVEIHLNSSFGLDDHGRFGG